jgi:hypothetical protein
MGSDKVFEFKLKRLDNLIDVIRQLCNLFKSSGHTMRIIRFDVQFLTKEISAYLLRASPRYEKIDMEHPAPYEHGQNGKAENIIQKVENSIQKYLKDSNAPKDMWGMISTYVCKARNSMNSDKNPAISRNEAFGGAKTDLKVTPMIPFGSRVLAHIPVKHQKALGYKCFETISMGSADGVKGGIILRNMKTKKNIIKRTFKVLGPGSSDDYDPSFDLNIEIEDVEEEMSSIPSLNFNSEPDSPTFLDRDYIDLNRNSIEVINKYKYYFNYVKLLFDDDFAKTTFKVIGVVKENISRGPGSKTLYFKYYDTIKFPGGPIKDIDFEYTPCSEILKDKHVVFDSMNNREGGKVNTIVSMKNDIRVYRTDFKTELAEPPPKNLNEARAHKEQGYFQAFLSELDSFHKHGVDVPADLDIEDIDPDLILQLIPLFEKKFSGANFEKFKCRMVVLGNKWRNAHGVSTYAGMIGIDTLKILLAVGASLDLDMVKFDVKTAFLKTEVDPKHRYYVRRPPGARDAEMPYISKPRCYVYGHPLANPGWDDTLAPKLMSMGGKPTVYDPNIYIIKNELGTALISTIVDDMPAFYDGGPSMLKFIKSNLEEIFEITVDDPLTNVFGMDVTRDRPERKIKRIQLNRRVNLGIIFNKLRSSIRQKKQNIRNNPKSKQNKKIRKQTKLPDNRSPTRSSSKCAD